MRSLGAKVFIKERQQTVRKTRTHTNKQSPGLQFQQDYMLSRDLAQGSRMTRKEAAAKTLGFAVPPIKACDLTTAHPDGILE